ncbi:MAG: hypothetical protein GY850_16730 [bacterium]|nr:hypothetical protein [bacterium]
MGALINRRRFMAFLYLNRCYDIVVLLLFFSSIFLSIFVCFKAIGHSETIPPLFDGCLVLETTDDYSAIIANLLRLQMDGTMWLW